MMKRQEAHNLWRDWISSVSFSTKPFILWFDSWRPHIMLSTHSLLYSIWILSHERGKGSGKNINIYRGSDFTSEDFNKLLSLFYPGMKNEKNDEERERKVSYLLWTIHSSFFSILSWDETIDHRIERNVQSWTRRWRDRKSRKSEEEEKNRVWKWEGCFPHTMWTRINISFSLYQ